MRTKRLELRLTDEERTSHQAAATAVGESLLLLPPTAANRAADILADERTITLTEDEESASSTRSRPSTITPSPASRTSAQDVSAPRAATERYDPTDHDVSRFESGNEALDRGLHRYAGQGERRDAARTFVIAMPVS